MLNPVVTVTPPTPWPDSLRLMALHLLLLGALASALYAFGIIRYLPAEDNLFRWDVLWYDQIRQAGYAYTPTGLSNVAFFPLFPYLWRFTGLGLLGISLLNAGLFVGAATWLSHQLRVPPRLQLLWLSTPVLLFMIVPYSEAVFFCFGALLVAGLRRQRLSWWLVGLLGCGLTRSASTMFLPALLFMVLLWASQPGQRGRALRWGGLGLLMLGLTVGIVAFMQWQQVGEPLAFVKVQRYWGHFWRWPTLPLHDPSGINELWLDAAALWWGLLAIGACCWLAWQWLTRQRGGRDSAVIISPEVVFSLGYCVCGCLYILTNQGGSLWNFGRYLLSTPFFLVVLLQLSALPAWKPRTYLLLAGATMLLWQAFGIYTEGFDSFTTLQALWYFGLLTTYLLTYLAWRQLRWQAEATILLYCFNLVMLLHLLEGWLQYYVVQ